MWLSIFLTRNVWITNYNTNCDVRLIKHHTNILVSTKKLYQPAKHYIYSTTHGRNQS